jgi:protein-S-isoprenylcysteine O-methyltransferase Ste14
MQSTKPFTLIAALIFALVALLHVYRLFTQFQVVLGSHEIPMWVSYVGVLLPGLLAIMLYRESRS